MAGQKVVPAPTTSAPSVVPPTGTVNNIAVSGRRTIPGGTFFRNVRRMLWSTLKKQFITLASAGFLLSLILALVSMLLFQRAATDLNTIVYSSIPSVDSAQRLAQYMDDIDAKSADFLGTGSIKTLVPCSIVGPNDTSKLQSQKMTVHDCDKANVAAEIGLANHQLYLSAHNVTFPGEETAVERITAGMQEYVGDITLSQQQYLQANGSSDPSNIHLRQAYQAYVQANQVLSQHITNQSQANIESSVPACPVAGHTLTPAQWTGAGIDTNIDCLVWINKSHVDAAYADTMHFMGYSTVALSLLCLIVCGVLGFALLRMMFITHRVINPGLTLALLVALIFSSISISLLASYQGSDGVFKQIVQDSYGSIYDAAILQRAATNANADESRWLLASMFGDTAAVNHWTDDWNANKAQSEQYITLAQKNQTYPEEVQPLNDMATYWRTYTTLDAQVRIESTQPSALLQAEQISTGPSNAAFSQFTAAVQRLSDANAVYYQSFLTQMGNQLAGLTDFAVAIFVASGLLMVWGISSRLKDF